MFGKLLKYDIQAIGRYFWIIAASVLGASVVGGAALRFLNEASAAGEEASTIVTLLSIGAMLLFMLCFVALVASIAVTDILLISRFYKNFFTDEGYLTFTLPVTRRQHLFSKFVNAMIWLTLHVLLLIIAFVLLFGIGTIGLEHQTPAGELFFTFNVNDTSGDFSLVWQEIGFWLIVFLAEIPLLFLVSLGFGVAMIYFCFTLGAIHAKKAKVVVSIGIYYLINSVLSTILSFVLIFGMVSLGLDLPILLAQATTGTICAVIALIILAVTVAIATLAVILYNITLGKLERKLNLA